MSDNHYKRRRGGRGHNSHGSSGKQPARKEDKAVDESSIIIQAFRGFQGELDFKHDKHERLVKLSRDITIESKRTIFLLQRVSGSNEEETEKILSEAESKFKEVQELKWRIVAKELDKEDPYKFLRAYSAGLQEYIEAVSFWYFLKHNSLINWRLIQDDLMFQEDNCPLEEQPENENEPTEPLEAIPSDKTESIEPQEEIPTDKNEPTEPLEATPTDKNEPTEPLDSIATDKIEPTEPKEAIPADNNECEEAKPEEDSTNTSNETICVHVPPVEYMLGIADLTGELMRAAINSVGQGQLDEPHRICGFMRTIYEAFISYGNFSRELNRKLTTLKQSLSKVENACYTLQVRGSEVPKDMLAEVIRSSNGERDYEMEGGD